MVGFAERKAEFDALGVKIIAASADPLDKAKEVADEVGFPIGYGVTKEIADRLGSWWLAARDAIQPTELILNGDNKVVASSYSDGPLGRIDASDVIALVKFYDARAKAQT